MEPHQKTMHACPFCGKETLEALTWPGHMAANTSRAAGGAKTTFHRKSDGFELLSEKCPNCGKTASEIRKAWKEGIDKRDAEAKKRRLEELKVLGFSGKLG